MSPEEMLDRWAPLDAPWSEWAKPVLFAARPQPAPAVPGDPNLSALDPAIQAVVPRAAALVIDLPGAMAVAAGLDAARWGFRPVPLFNATTGPRPIVDVAPIMAALAAGAMAPALVALPAEAPAAFLIDAGRNTPGIRARPGDFDNRSLVFPQDFPSARFLREHGIDSVVWLSQSERPANDLVHVLLRWQDAGLALLRLNVGDPISLHPLTVRRPRFYRTWWYRALVMLGFRRSGAGGFGAVVPEPSSG